MQTARILCFALIILGLIASPAAAQNNYCAPPSPPPQPQPQDPPCPACDPKECEKCTKSPVYVGAGTYVREDVDLSIRTTAFGLGVTRHYDSSRVFDGPFGIGWTSSITPRIHYATYAVTPTTYQYVANVVMPHGGLYQFTRNSSSAAFLPPVGRRETLVQQADGTYKLTLQDSRIVLTFNLGGSLTSMVDEYGNSILYEYDTSGRLQRIVDGSGSNRAVNVTWNASTGRIASVTDNVGRTVRYTYDAQGRLEGVASPVTPLGEQSLRYAYVEGRFAPLLSTVRDRWQRLITKVEWDSSDRVKSYTEGEYNDANPAASVGEKYFYEYVPKGDASSGNQPYTRKTWTGGGQTYRYVPGTGLVTNDKTDYDGGGSVTARYDDNNNKIEYTYSNGRVQTEKHLNPWNQIELQWSYFYDTQYPEKVARQVSSAPHLWQGARYVYFGPGDPAPGALKQVYHVRSDGVTEDKVAEYVVDTRGRVTAENGPIGSATTHYNYDAAGNLTSVKTGTTMQYGHDALGRVTSSTDQAGHVTTYTYDDLDRILTVTLPKPSASSTLNFTTAYLYDQYDAATGLAFVHVTDPNGRVTKLGYDALGNLVRSIDALNNVTKYAYRHNLLKSITDANDNVTSYAYNGSRQLESTTFPDGNVERYTYTGGGRMLTRTDRRGVVERLYYDRYGRLQGVKYPNDSSKFVDYVYDGQNLRYIHDTRQGAMVTYELTYDTMFRVKTEGTWNLPRITYTYRYDANPQLKSYTLAPYSGSDRTTTVYYTYDTLDRVTKVSFNEFTYDVTIDYDPRGMYSSITFGNGMERNFTYDDQGRLTKIANTHPTLGNIATFDYSYDRDWAAGGAWTMLGQRDRATVSAHSEAYQVPGTYKYHYDAVGQLTRVENPNASWTSWSYDGIGNRILMQTSGGAYTEIAYHKYNGNPKSSSRLAEWSYDANGNRLTGGVETWDVANRLVSHGGVSYVYDFANRRTKYGNVSYVYQGSNIARERDTTLGVLNDYLFGPGTDEPLLRLDAANVKHYYAVDGLGSVVAAVTGNTVEQGNRYDAWGNRTGSGAATFGYTGREFAAGNLYYYRARYYDPARGRFISEDPLHYVDGMNSYRYVRSNPVNFTDPSGLKVCRCTRRLAFQVGSDVLAVHIPKVSFVHHEFVQIVPDGSACGGLGGSAWGYQNQGGGKGAVEPEVTPAFNASLECSPVPCIDEDKLRKNINAQLGKTGSYEAWCKIGKGWNKKNCQGWVDAVLAASKKPNCCAKQ